MSAWPMRLIMLALSWTLSHGAMAQTTPPASAPAQQPLSAGQIDQLVAPIALYPDPLLAQVLIASTYPLEVVQADRFAKNNRNLKGDPLKAALAKESWDDSVKSLVAVPTVLAMMNDKLDWTPEARRCGARTAARCHGRGAAAAAARQGQQQAGDHPAADGEHRSG